MKTRHELELCVAACVLIEQGRNIYHVDIAIEDFILPATRATIGAAREVQPVDSVIIRNWAIGSGIKTSVSEITESLQVVPTSKNLLHYVVLLKREIYNDKIKELRQDVALKAKTVDLLELSREIEAEEARLCTRYIENIPDGALLPEATELITRIEQLQDNEALIQTGWRLLDDMLAGGLLPNELIIIAARPSVGKTAAAVQIAIDCRLKVCIFSLEMSKAQIVPRILAALALTNTKVAARKPSQVPPQIRNNLLSVTPDLLAAAERITVIDDADQTIESIRRQARREVDAGAKIIIIDYLQLLDCTAIQSRERAVATISRGLKNMSKELNVPVICLAQMNRGIEGEKRLPRLSDLRESGAIEQDANAVLFLHRVHAEGDNINKQIVFLLAKGRDVGESYRRGYFNADHQRFYAEGDRA